VRQRCGFIDSPLTRRDPGHILKVINQAVIAIQTAIQSEAVELTKKYGLDPVLLKEFLEFDIPEGLLAEDYCSCGELAFMYKDLGYLLEMAHDNCANIPIVSLVHEMFKSSKIYGEPNWRPFGIRTYYQRLNNDKIQ
jgi:3-hydroxyisobutyrate dehydrogenase-like beta-hydroxyacid dehydrogenase